MAAAAPPPVGLQTRNMFTFSVFTHFYMYVYILYIYVYSFVNILITLPPCLFPCAEPTVAIEFLKLALL